MPLSRRHALQGLVGSAAVGALSLHGMGCSPHRCPGTPTATAASRPPPPPPATAPAAAASASRGTDPFRVLDVAGSHREIGRAMGETFRSVIWAAIHEQPSYRTCCELARGTLSKHLAAYQQAVRDAWPGLLEELAGMAEACGIAEQDLFAWNCRSELDAASDPCPPGCSTVGWVDERQMILAHNEDGNAAYTGRMFVVRARPPSGIAFAALVYPGTLPGNGPGLNARGVVQSTNYISPCDAVVGIPRYFVGRAVLEARDLEHAVAIAQSTSRAFPWHHNLASLADRRLVSLETWPGRAHRRDVRGLHLHTNHLVHPEMKDLPERKAYLARSSLPRLEALERRLRGQRQPDRHALLMALYDRSGSPCKVCRRPGDEVPGATVATALWEAPTRQMLLMDGPACGGPAQVVVTG